MLPAIGCGHAPSSQVEPDTMASLKDKNVLLVYGGWDGHHPTAFRDWLVPWLQAEGAHVVVSPSLDIYTDQLLMDTTDLIIQTWTLGQISGPQLNGLLRAVKSGTGYAGWHGGIVDAFRTSLDYHMLTGAQFIAHPGDNITYTIEPADPNDPLMQGIDAFSITSEQYYLLADPNLHVLARTTFSGAHLDWIAGRTMPVIWKHAYGNGRVFVTTIGHQLSDFDVPEAELTLKRGLVWAAR